MNIPIKNGIMAKCFTVSPYPIGRWSTLKNSVHIQNELAEIQTVMAILWQSSDTICLVLQAMMIETIMVGTIIEIPSQVNPIHQPMSLKIQNTICRFSYTTINSWNHRRYTKSHQHKSNRTCNN